MTARWLILLLASMFQFPVWADEPLTLVLAPPQVDISADFAGTGVKATGSIRGPGDLILKVAGPQQLVTLSRKTRLGPFWVGGEMVKADGVPSLLFIFSSKPIDSLLPPAEREQHALRLDSVPVRIEPKLQADTAGAWSKAFFALKQQSGYYRESGDAIMMLEGGRFAADIRLPGDLQTGTYTVEVLLVRSGKVAGRAVSEFTVRLVGMEHWLWSAAHDTPWLFGILFTVAAMLLGLALTAIPYRLR